MLERAFAGCSRMIVTKLHGGFSGSLVLKTDSYGLDGRPKEQTVTKLDDAKSMLKEFTRTKALVGAGAAQVQRGPFLVDACGKGIEAGASTEKDFGCVVLDMAGHGGTSNHEGKQIPEGNPPSPSKKLRSNADDKGSGGGTDGGSSVVQGGPWQATDGAAGSGVGAPLQAPAARTPYVPRALEVLSMIAPHALQYCFACSTPCVPRASRLTGAEGVAARERARHRAGGPV